MLQCKFESADMCEPLNDLPGKMTEPIRSPTLAGGDIHPVSRRQSGGGASLKSLSSRWFRIDLRRGPAFHTERVGRKRTKPGRTSRRTMQCRTSILMEIHGRQFQSAEQQEAGERARRLTSSSWRRPGEPSVEDCSCRSRRYDRGDEPLCSLCCGFSGFQLS